MDNITICPGSRELADNVAAIVVDLINAKPDCVICFAAGDTPLPMLRKLVALQKEGAVNLNNAYYVSLDEWWGIGYDTPGSCIQVMKDAFYLPAGISESRMALFDGTAGNAQREKDRISRFLDAHGGLDLIVLGVGMNGHIGFIEPGVHSENVCELIPLSKTTKEVSIKYFGYVTPLEYGITLGVKTMLQAEKIIVMADGTRKREIMKRVLQGPVSEECPASLLRTSSKTQYYMDTAAAEFLLKS